MHSPVGAWQTPRCRVALTPAHAQNHIGEAARPWLNLAQQLRLSEVDGRRLHRSRDLVQPISAGYRAIDRLDARVATPDAPVLSTEQAQRYGVETIVPD